MANPHRGEVAFKAGERELKLSFSANAMCELEDALDMGIPEVGQLMQAGRLRVKHARALFWAALRDHHSDIDMIGAGKLMTEAGIQKSMDAVAGALAAALPDAEEEKKGGGPRKPGGQDGTGPAA
ncbi:MAG: gene transfer agent family protein [Rhizobiales bacterium]|nr:gene transfer agent family protein [Hyphomicrobiales bacterium]